MNCNICIGHLRENRKCAGCRSEDDRNKPDGCTRKKCIILNCIEFQNTNKKYCFPCKKYPCRRLVQLDKRYRAKYRMSMLENLNFIKTNGIRKFVQKEIPRWTCSKCGAALSCHRKVCLSCGTSLN
ncbi:MAG: DUF3795 domain-containing protein [Candidatus Omnitrophica bacterium]|nr:DUF3795 domain-containing protein [Candidatus Omnitrophota bacterium]